MGEESAYTGEIGAYETLQAWGADKCVPLVREITFENAEELTEEGLPFLILFHHPDDKEVGLRQSGILTDGANERYWVMNGEV